MKRAILFLLLFGCEAAEVIDCAEVRARQYAVLSVGHIGCSARDIEIDRCELLGGPAESWRASCGDRVLFCSMQDGPDSVVQCTEPSVLDGGR